jgi:hypothetical protein
MPYRHAHYWLLSLYPLTLLAFWPNYFSRLTDAAPALHFHGITAALWIALLAAQSWTIHRRHNHLHKTLGYSSFLLFPFFLTGGLLVLQTMASAMAAGVSPFYDLFGARLATFDIVSVLGVGYFYFMALRHRRNVHLHSRFMIVTIFFLLGPILARFLGAMPPISIRGPDTFDRFPIAFHLGNLIALVFTVALYRRSGRHGRPFLIASALILLQSVLFESLGAWPAWERLFVWIARVPTPALASLGLGASFLVVWFGWISGQRPRQTMAPA